MHRRQRLEIRIEGGHVLVLVARDGQRAFDGAVQVDSGFLRLIGMREFLHGANDRGNASQALFRTRQGGRYVGEDERDVLMGFGAVGGRGGRRDVSRRTHGGKQLPVGLDYGREAGHRGGHEFDVIGDELNGGIDLVRDPRGQAADGLELLRRGELALQTPILCHIEHQTA